jgi:uncharacterized protein (DUF1684 family)
MIGRLSLALVLLVGAAPDPTHVKKVEEWRAKHESDYRRDWVTVAGLHFLKPGPNSAGSATSNDIVVSNVPPTIGRFVLDGQRVRFEPQAGVKVTLKDQPVTTAIELKDDGQPQADELAVGSVRLVIHLSGDKRSLRVRDPNSDLARGFVGFKWFPIDEKYRVVGRFIKDAQASARQVVNTLGDIDTYTTDGVIEFTLAGKKMTVRPFTTRPSGSTSCSRTSRAARKPTTPRGSFTPISPTMARRSSISTRRTTRRARSIHIRRVRFR